VHRTKQALFHAAVVPDLATHPLPPPHPELLKYFSPPARVLKRARGAIDACAAAFKVREGAAFPSVPPALYLSLIIVMPMCARLLFFSFLQCQRRC
jgi:hypothetical protein